MDDVDVNFLRHIAGAYDRRLGQLCSRCAAVLDAGDAELPSPAPGIRAYAVAGLGFPPGAVVLMSEDGGFLAVESVLKADRDRSDEADCKSIIPENGA